MGTSENKTAKLVTLVTYAVAVVCLLLGMFLPLFGGKGILALQLPNVFTNLANKSAPDFGKEFTAAYPILFMGKGKQFDFMAFTVMLYAVITLVSLIMLIPVGVNFKRENKVSAVLAYTMEIAAALVLSLYLIIALGQVPEVKLSYNMLIAFCGTVFMLIIQSLVNKKATGAVKSILFLISVVAFVALFNFWIAGKFGRGWNKFADKLKCTPLVLGTAEAGSETGGIDILKLFFEAPFKDVVNALPNAKEKAALCLGLIVSLAVLLNFFIDIISLATNAKRKGLVFNAVRYGFETAAVIALFITAAICKYRPALLLCLILIAAAIQLIISVARLVLAAVKAKQEAKEPVPVESYFRPEPAAEPAEDEYPVYPENYNASPFPYPPAVYSAPEEIEDEYVEDEPAPKPPVAEYKPTPQYSPVHEYRPVSDYKPEPPVQRPPVQSMPEYIQPPQAPVPRTVASEIPTHNVYQTYTPNIPATEKPVDQIYKVNTVYQGPTDEFMRKLNNNEKIEFSMIFIEKSKGDIGKVPDYIIGGDNKKFFSSVFIYLGRMRSIVSDGLLNKMYKELNML